MRTDMDAVLLLGHGSRLPQANSRLYEAARMVEERLPGVEVAPAYLQMARPDLVEAATALAEKGRRCIAVMPFFLFPGAHVLEDIPDALASLRVKYPSVNFIQCEPLGVHPLLADVAVERIREGLR